MQQKRFFQAKVVTNNEIKKQTFIDMKIMHMCTNKIGQYTGCLVFNNCKKAIQTLDSNTSMLKYSTS